MSVFLAPPPETVNFSVCCEWELNDPSKDCPNIVLKWPKQFGHKVKSKSINTINESMYLTDINQDVDDDFMNDILSNQFLFILELSHSHKRSKSPSKHHKSSKSDKENDKSNDKQHRTKNKKDDKEKKEKNETEKIYKENDKQNQEKETKNQNINDENGENNINKVVIKEPAKNKPSSSSRRRQRERISIIPTNEQTREPSPTAPVPISIDLSSIKAPNQKDKNDAKKGKEKSPSKHHSHKKKENKKKSSQSKKEENITIDTSSTMDDSPKKESKPHHHHHHHHRSPTKSIDNSKDGSTIETNDTISSKSSKHSSKHKSRSKSVTKDSDSTKSESKDGSHHKHRSKSRSSSTSKSHSSGNFPYLQIDGHVFFLDDVLQYKVEAQTEVFKTISLQVEISQSLLNDYFLKRFAPAFLHIQKVENLKEDNYIDCNGCPILINSETGDINTVIVFNPREQTDVSFNMYKDKSKSTEIIGHGLVEYTKNKRSKNSELGFAIYQFLPKRKRNISILTTQISLESLDPAEEYGGPTIPSLLTKVKERNEPPNSVYYRFIITMKNDAEGFREAKIFEAFLNSINDCDISFKKAITTTYDVITGFHVKTPNEHIWVLESRAKDPQKLSFKLSDYISKMPSFVKIVFDTEISFEFPRLYYKLDKLIQTIDLPISIIDFVRIDGLYFKKSEYAPLFSVSQKLYNLFSSKDAISNKIFPSVREIKGLIKRSQDLSIAPINFTYNIQPPSVSSTNSFVRKNFALTKKSKPVLASSAALVCHEDFKIEKTEEIPTPPKQQEKPRILVIKLPKRSISTSDHIEISNLSGKRKMIKQNSFTSNQRNSNMRRAYSPQPPNKDKNINISIAHDWRSNSVKKAPNRVRKQENRVIN